MQLEHFLVDLLLDFSTRLFEREAVLPTGIDLNFVLVAECVRSHDDCTHDVVFIVSRLLVHLEVGAALLAQADSGGIVALEGARVGLHVVVNALETVSAVLLHRALEEMHKADMLLERPCCKRGNFISHRLKPGLLVLLGR